MEIFPVRFELTCTAPEAVALSIRPREHMDVIRTCTVVIIPKSEYGEESRVRGYEYFVGVDLLVDS